MKAKKILLTDVLKAISHSRSLELFKSIALAKQEDGHSIISKTNITNKQYYSRMSRLMKAGLIKRKNGKYSLTSFGKVIYHIALATIENAISNYWKLKAIDSLEISKDLPAEELKKIIDTFIDNQKIKAILYKDHDKFDPHPAEIANRPIQIDGTFKMDSDRV